MRITIFSGGLSGGGTERVICNLSNYLCENGHKVEIITMSDDKASYTLNKDVNRIVLLKTAERGTFVFNQAKRVSRLVKYMKSNRTDLYLVMLPVTIIMLLSLHRFTKAPIVVAERADPNQLHVGLKILIKHLSKNADGFVFQTKDAMSWYGNRSSKENSIIIPNAISKDVLDKIRYADTRKKKIVAVGRMTEQKNFKMLIKAFKKVHEKHMDYHLVIYGEGPQRQQIVEMISQLGLEKAVSLPGYVTNIADSIYDAAVYVLSSNYEGIPNSLVEAMALGVPCIATDCPVGGPKSLIQNNINGILVSVGDINKMAYAINYLIENPIIANEIGKASRSISDTLSPNTIYKQWENYLVLMTKRKN